MGSTVCQDQGSYVNNVNQNQTILRVHHVNMFIESFLPFTLQKAAGSHLPRFFIKNCPFDLKDFCDFYAVTICKAD